MNVYAVIWEIDYEGEKLISIYADEAGAEKEAARLNKQNDTGESRYYVDEQILEGYANG